MHSPVRLCKGLCLLLLLLLLALLLLWLGGPVAERWWRHAHCTHGSRPLLLLLWRHLEAIDRSPRGEAWNLSTGGVNCTEGVGGL